MKVYQLLAELITSDVRLRLRVQRRAKGNQRELPDAAQRLIRPSIICKFNKLRSVV